MELNKEELPHIIMGACMEVHKNLGNAMDLAAYKDCLAVEFRMREIFFKRDHDLTFEYKGYRVESSATIDFIVEDLVMISILTVERLEQVHRHQLAAHLRLSGLETGLLVNFRAEKLRDGFKRLIVATDEVQSQQPESGE